jgi:Ni/Fe-hydrogenase subunit HybB-like protein
MWCFLPVQLSGVDVEQGRDCVERLRVIERAYLRVFAPFEVSRPQAGALVLSLGGRPFWNSSIVGPRFLASAFTAGPALITLALQVIRAVTTYKISDRSLLTLRAIVQVSMLINVFLHINEVFKELNSGNLHVGSSK